MKWFKHLYVQVIIAAGLGVIFGLTNPSSAIEFKILGESFLALVKMMIGPIIFCTIVLGMLQTNDLKKVGRIGLKAIVYFEVVSTLALILGLFMANWLKPGSEFHVDPLTLDPSLTSQYAEKAHANSLISILTHIIPKTLTDAFTGSGDLLQILLVAVLFGFAMNRLGEKATPVKTFIQSLSHILFKIMNTLMKLAPLGAFGAMAFTIGTYGAKSFAPLLALMGTFYLTCLIFIFLILGLLAWFMGFNIFKLVRFLREELLLVLATSSSESALVPMMEKLETLGCSKSTIGVVVPTGYSFNLDGTNIYLTLATLFIAQALGVDLSLSQQISILLVAMLTSKGASGVTGAGFITLAATLAVVPTVPVAGLALILGIDRFMSEARALTNLVGNAVATIIISKWEKELNVSQLRSALQRNVELEDIEV